MVIGTCCHHRCTARAYPNHPFLHSHGFSPADFTALCKLSSSGVDPTSSSGRADAARRVKDLLDEARVEYLSANGFDALLHTYIDAAISPENVLIVASPTTMH